VRKSRAVHIPGQCGAGREVAVHSQRRGCSGYRDGAKINDRGATIESGGD
jgi:hypothetical protein